MLRFCDAIGFPEDELFDLWPFSLASNKYNFNQEDFTRLRVECIISGFPAIQGMLGGNRFDEHDLFTRGSVCQKGKLATIK